MKLLPLACSLVCAATASSQDPAQVLRGQNDWLYIAGNGHSQRCFEGEVHLDADALERWCAVVASRRVWCEARDIRYALLVTPDKHQIYPEHVPEDWRAAEADTCLDRFFAALEEAELAAPIDVRATLLAAKEEQQVYFPYGSHWNDRGGFLAYHALAQRLGLEAWPRTDFEEIPSPVGGDDLGILLGIEHPPQEAPYLSPLRERRASLDEIWEGAHGLIDGRTKHPDSRLPRAILFRDSFANWLWYYLAEHFSSLRMESVSFFDPRIVLEHRAAVVIDQFVERQLEFQNPEPLVEGEELERLTRWVAAGAALQSDRRANRGSGSVRLADTNEENYPLEADLSDLERRQEAVLRLELHAEDAGFVEVGFRSSRRRRDTIRVRFEPGRDWLFVPLEGARRVSEAEIYVRAEQGSARLLAWELRGI